MKQFYFGYSGILLKTPTMHKNSDITITEIHILSVIVSECCKFCVHTTILLTIFVTLADMRRLPEANARCYCQKGPWKKLKSYRKKKKTTYNMKQSKCSMCFSIFSCSYWNSVYQCVCMYVMTEDTECAHSPILPCKIILWLCINYSDNIMLNDMEE
jgi:hypothetical protein